MQFIDKVKIKLKAGNGGNGIVAFAHLKYNPLGGPSGGDGGNGGSIIFKADSNKSTLLDLRFKKIIKALDGENGKTNNMYGKSQEDVIVKVPIGTIIKDNADGLILADLSENGQEEIICQGGKGGLGNRHFATSKNSAPEYAKLGTSGEEKEVTLELKLLADVGLVGFPSVGKSTLLSVVSKAKPEIGDYPFTTLTPSLGMISIGGDSFVMADLPGLIEGASDGKGLGIDFLKHIERCRVILHVLDMGSSEGRDPLNDYEIINQELSKYPGKLDEKKQIVLANKMDLDEGKENLKRFKKKYPDIEVFEACTIINEGLTPVLYRLKDLLQSIPYFPLYQDEQVKVFKYQKPSEFKVINQGNGIFKVVGEKIERLFDEIDFDDELSVQDFARKLTNMNVDDELRKAGCVNGDKVFIKKYSFDFIERDEDENSN